MVYETQAPTFQSPCYCEWISMRLVSVSLEGLIFEDISRESIYSGCGFDTIEAAVPALPLIDESVKPAASPTILNSSCGEGRAVLVCGTDNQKDIKLCQYKDRLRYTFGKSEAKPDITLETDVNNIEQIQSTIKTVTFVNSSIQYHVTWIGDEPSALGNVEVEMPNNKQIVVSCKAPN